MTAHRDIGAILRPGHVLSEEDVATLQQRMAPPWLARQRRLDERDRVIRELASKLFPAMATKARARAISHELDRRLAGFSTPEIFEHIAVLNGRKHLGVEAVYKILRCGRSDPV